MPEQESFFENIEKMAFDKEQRRKLKEHITSYAADHAAALSQFSDLPLARERASFARWKAMESLDKYLPEFENNFNRKGGKVIWAPDAETALSEIGSLLKQYPGKKIALGKSMTAEEIGLPAFLEKTGIAFTRTGLGNHVLGKTSERPSHPVSPLMNKSLDEITSALKQSATDLSARDIAGTASDVIREQLQQSSISISGANFLVADAGAVAVTENEGNIRLGSSHADVQIVIAGIDKMIPSINDLEMLWPLLATYGTGQRFATYNSLLLGPRLSDEEDGPKEMIVILLDNGRSAVLEKKEQRQVLKCINCGACHNVCPVFKTIGGLAYGSTYTGPIGSVITPLQRDAKEFKHLSQASTICGACTDVCPVLIPLHTNLLTNRRDFAEAGLNKKGEKMMWFAWKKGVLDRKKMNRSSGIKNFILRTFFKKSWGERRVFPEMAARSFNELWKEKHEAKK